MRIRISMFLFSFVLPLTYFAQAHGIEFRIAQGVLLLTSEAILLMQIITEAKFATIKFTCSAKWMFVAGYLLVTAISTVLYGATANILFLLLLILTFAIFWKMANIKMEIVPLYAVVAISCTLQCCWFYLPLGGGFEDLNRNGFALVGAVGAVTSAAIKKRYLKLFCFGFCFITVILVGSRNGMVSVILGLLTLIYFFVITRSTRKVRQATILFVIFLLCFQGWFICESISNLLLLNDQSRGFEAGFSRRLYAWEEAIDCIKNNPFIGLGARASWNVTSNGMSVHNGILALGVESGIVGLVSGLAIYFIAIKTHWKRVASCQYNSDAWKESVLGIAAILTIAGLSLGESIFFSLGTPAGVMSFLSLMSSWKYTEVS